MPIPEEWRGRVLRNQMLFTSDDQHPEGFTPASVWGRHASIANGVLGTIVDSGTVFLSGTFNGPGTMSSPSHAWLCAAVLTFKCERCGAELKWGMAD